MTPWHRALSATHNNDPNSKYFFLNSKSDKKQNNFLIFFHNRRTSSFSLFSFLEIEHIPINSEAELSRVSVRLLFVNIRLFHFIETNRVYLMQKARIEICEKYLQIEPLFGNVCESTQQQELILNRMMVECTLHS